MYSCHRPARVVRIGQCLFQAGDGSATLIGAGVVSKRRVREERDVLTAAPPPPTSPPYGVHDEPAQVPLWQPEPLHERSEQLIPIQVPPDPQSGPEQPRLMQLSPRQCPLPPPPPPPPPSQSEPTQPPFKQPVPLHTPSTQFGPMQPNGVQFVPVHTPLEQSLPEQPKLAQRGPGSC